MQNGEYGGGGFYVDTAVEIIRSFISWPSRDIKDK